MQKKGLWKYSTFTLLFLLLVSACDNDSGSNKNKTLNIGANADPAIVASLPFQERSFMMGTAGYVPNHYPDSSEADWQSFFDRGAAEYGGLFGIHVSPGTDKDENNILVQLRMAYQDMSYVIPYVELGFSHELGPFTTSMGEQLVQVARANAQKFKPIYMSIGVEINSNYINEPDSYDLYVQYAREALDAVKEVSPNTIRMTNFQLDSMKGENQLTGQNHPSHWFLIDGFAGKIDALSFTVYPYLHYTQVEDIPDNYLSEIREHSDLPILITETAWPTVDLPTFVEGSDALQIDYMIKIAEQSNNMDTQAIIWVLPRDAAFGVGGGVFDNISLFSNAGQAKPAYEYWKAIHALPMTEQ